MFWVDYSVRGRRGRKKLTVNRVCTISVIVDERSEVFEIMSKVCLVLFCSVTRSRSVILDPRIVCIVGCGIVGRVWFGVV